MKMALGLDTSAYTTSLALAPVGEASVIDHRKVLAVKAGERGLRQSEAVFDHVRNLPLLFAEVEAVLSGTEILAVGASVSPRPVEGSYMPVFVPGSSWARCLASTLGVPFYPSSHQEGHIRAALIGTGIDQELPFIAIHFSGGTSEVLESQRTGAGKYRVYPLSRGRDLAAGQLVDRVGVKMGLPFPSGPQMEKLAMSVNIGDQELPVIPSAVTARGFSFSGAEAEAFRLLERGWPREVVAFAVLRCIANTLEKVIRLNCEEKPFTQVLLAGGVMANQLIKSRLLARFDGSRVRLFFARPDLATDNAVGVALLTLEQHLG